MGLIFGRKKRKAQAAVGMKGQPLHVNPPADSSPRLKRNLARIAKCQFYMGVFQVGTKEHDGWKREYEERKLWLARHKEVK